MLQACQNANHIDLQIDGQFVNMRVRFTYRWFDGMGTVMWHTFMSCRKVSSSVFSFALPIMFASVPAFAKTKSTPPHVSIVNANALSRGRSRREVEVEYSATGSNGGRTLQAIWNL